MRLASRRRCSVVVVVGLVASGVLACGAGEDVDEDEIHGELTLSITGISTDLVSKTDKGLFPDDRRDGHFAATANGSFDAFILVSTTDGNPALGQQWDTLVDEDPVPPLGFGYSKGGETWVLAVFEDGQLVNDSAGRVSLGEGMHILELVGGDSPYFVPGVEYTLYGRSNGKWIESNVAIWP